MYAGGMDAFSNYRHEYIPRIREPAVKLTLPGARRAYAEQNLRRISPKLMAREAAERERIRERLSAMGGQPPSNREAVYENRRYLMSERMLENALGKIESIINIPFRHLQYIYHEDSGEYFVRIIDDETDEVIREIPPEKLLNIYASLKEVAGLLYDARR